MLVYLGHCTSSFLLTTSFFFPNPSTSLVPSLSMLEYLAILLHRKFSVILVINHVRWHGFHCLRYFLLNEEMNTCDKIRFSPFFTYPLTIGVVTAQISSIQLCSPLPSET